MRMKKIQPVKVPLSPSLRQAYCCLCSKYIAYAYNRKYLWHKGVDRKTRICTLVEQVLLVNVTRSGYTELICSPCFIKVKSLNRKLQSVREEVNTYIQKIGWHGAAMKCKQEEKQDITVAEPQLNQHRCLEGTDSLVGQSLSDSNSLPSLPESPPGDRPQQCVFMSALRMTSLPLGTVVELGSSPPAQSVFTTPSSSTPGGLGGSTAGGLRRSTRKRSTPTGLEGSISGGSARSVLAGTRKSTAEASRRSSPKTSGSSAPEALVRSTPEALGRSTPETLGRSTAAAPGRSSPEASGRSSQEILGRSFPETSWTSSPEALGRSSPSGNGRSAVLTERDYGASTSHSPHSENGSTLDDHQMWDTATRDVKASACWDPEQHSYCRTDAPKNDTRIFMEIHAGGASKLAHEDFVLKDELAPMGGDYGDSSKELLGMYDLGDNTNLQTELVRAVKIEQSEPACEDVRDCPSTKKETCGPQYVVPEVHCVYTVKEDDGSSRYVDALLPEDNKNNNNNNNNNAEVMSFIPARRRNVKRLWKCTMCQLVCLSRQAFVNHARVHTGEKPFMCGWCGMSFAQSSYLKRHSWKHTGERPYACSMCDKAYRSTYERTVHERTHRDDRPYLCATCGKAFVCNSDLRRHEVSHVAVRRYACPTCGKSSVSYSQLTRHRKIHSGLKPFSCRVCGRSFLDRWHLGRHERSRHPRESADAAAASYISASTS